MDHRDQNILTLDNFSPAKLNNSPLKLCTYLPDRASQLIFLLLDNNERMGQDLYGQLCRNGFRRSGNALYKPNCLHCMQCISSRVAVNRFMPSRRFRRVLKRNEDVSVTLHDSRIATSEHYALYQNYISCRHADGDMYPPSLSTFEQFLVNSPVNSLFLEVREPNGKLIAVAVTDKVDDGLSSIYTFFDTSSEYVKRSLGVYCILKQIEIARNFGLDYAYLGYWLPTVKKMSYKVEYTPIELLINGQWITFDVKPDAEEVIALLDIKSVNMRF